MQFVHLSRRMRRTFNWYFSLRCIGCTETHVSVGFGLFLLTLFIGFITLIGGAAEIGVAGLTLLPNFDAMGLFLFMLLLSLLLMAGPAALGFFGLLAALCLAAVYLLNVGQ